MASTDLCKKSCSVWEDNVPNAENSCQLIEVDTWLPWKPVSGDIFFLHVKIVFTSYPVFKHGGNLPFEE